LSTKISGLGSSICSLAPSVTLLDELTQNKGNTSSSSHNAHNIPWQWYQQKLLRDYFNITCQSG